MPHMRKGPSIGLALLLVLDASGASAQFRLGGTRTMGGFGGGGGLRGGGLPIPLGDMMPIPGPTGPAMPPPGDGAPPQADPHRRHPAASHATRRQPVHARRSLPSAPPLPPASRFIVPADGERRLRESEVLVLVKAAPPARLQRLERLERRLGLLPRARSPIALLAGELRLYGLARGAQLRPVVESLRASRLVFAAEPNFVFALQGDRAPPQPTPAALESGAAPPAAPTQYAARVLRLDEAHALAQGTDVRIGLIDSGVDETNPELRGRIVARLDVVGGTFVPHPHGTAMAGAIVAHQTLIGVAPRASLVAVRAFAGARADGSGFDVLRGLDFVVAQGARIVNLSFAGPQDALLRDALEAARRRGVVALAAAGNGGPSAPPVYPAAEPGVLAITATDASGKAFALANRGRYIAVAAPGVGILAPGLGVAVQMTSGTSIATAEASGVAALLLERAPHAQPDEIRRLLCTTARRLASDPDAGGAGLIDAAAALAAIH